MAAAMGYSQTQELAHRMESLMATVRQRRQKADHSLIDLMLRAIDSLRDLISDESEGRLARNTEDIATALATRTECREERVGDGGEGSLLHLRVTLDEDCVLRGVRAYMVLKRLGNMGTVVETEPSARDIEDERFERAFGVALRTHQSVESVRAALMAISEVSEVSVEQVAEEPAPDAETEERRAATIARAHAVPKLADAQTVRITVGHLDTMVNLVGELVILRSRLARIARDLGRPELSDTLDAFERVSGDLQQEVMQTRMVPVGNIFQRFPRMVRDLARDLGKDATLELDGLDIELDRTVLDEIGDPIVHLLRNCVDHGIESPEQREAAGKPPRGTIHLSAEREREHVRLTVIDDGRGMDAEAIWGKAVAAGRVDETDRGDYTDEDVLLLSCTPGLSTARQATKVSGRGVGMDVV
jgi:two-component system chemotaxis sensor kinase CheA